MLYVYLVDLMNEDEKRKGRNAKILKCLKVSLDRRRKERRKKKVI